MVILGRKIKATEGPVGQESPARAAQAEAWVYIHRRLLSARPGLVRGNGNIQTWLPGHFMKLGINSDAAAGLAVWGRWVVEERIAKTAGQCQLLEVEYWLGGTWAGNVSTRKCL